MSPESKKLFNIIILGVAFMFMFTAFQTCGNVAQTVIRSLNSTDFHGSGYTSLAIIYGVFSASNLITPSVVTIVGPQISMFVSGLFYSLSHGPSTRRLFSLELQLLCFGQHKETA
ncbi:Mfsd11 [Phodopus roborovskii]|uniref:Mfsd11 protein n=1 Tax=Phodopus roborovskii TaxID=109678 RepID=A0AAU9YMB6_PHORO|nr:Mfsd11 [Phodopus roborovskii]